RSLPVRLCGPPTPMVGCLLGRRCTDRRSVAHLLGLRNLSEGVVRAGFREDLKMIKESPLISGWIEEAGLTGEARGEARASRRALLLRLRSRFGQIPADLAARVEAADVEWCERVLERAARAESLSELDLS